MIITRFPADEAIKVNNTRITRALALGSFLWHKHRLGFEFWQSQHDRICQEKQLTKEAQSEIRKIREAQIVAYSDK